MLDANGRILPCCGAPKPAVDAVFGNLGDAPYALDSAYYLPARRSLRDRAAYGVADPKVYCANCGWDQDHTEFSQGEVVHYLRAAGRGALDAQTIEICSNW